MNSFVLYCNLTNKNNPKRESVNFANAEEREILAKLFSAEAVVLFCDNESVLRLQRFLELANFCKKSFNSTAKIIAVVADKNEYFLKQFGDLLITKNELDEKLKEFFDRNEFERFSEFGVIKQAEIAKKHLIDCTQAKLAKKLKISRSNLANLVRLNNLPQNIKDLLRENKIFEGHARCLLGLEPEKQQGLLDKILNEKLSVRAAEKLKTKM